MEWNTRRELDTKVAELQQGLSAMMQEDPPHSVAEIIAFVKGRKQEQVGVPACRQARAGQQGGGGAAWSSAAAGGPPPSEAVGGCTPTRR